MIRVSGNTYKHKSTLKSLGFRWNAKNKIWEIQSLSDLSAVTRLSGLIVENADGSEVDNRTHKQKYGRCEDAPCCGCCGNDLYGGYDSYHGDHNGDY